MADRSGYGAAWAVIAGLCLSAPACAQEVFDSFGYTAYGTPGLIDMPSATMAPDAELSFSSSYFEGTSRNTLTFQIAPWMTGSFRYSGINDVRGTAPGELLDRSFDLRLRLAREGQYRPAIAVGVQDFIGTGFYTAEYLVATKHLTPRLQFSTGLGWGRMASRDGFTNPLGALHSGFKTRDAAVVGLGGTLQSAQWFQGDAALFGGVAWKASDRLTFKVEYSTDAYLDEAGVGDLVPTTPWNIGVEYRVGPTTRLSAMYMQGDRVGVQITTAINPNRAIKSGTIEGAPTSFSTRPRGSYDQGWFDAPTQRATAKTALRQGLDAEGMILEAVDLAPTYAEIRIRNLRFDTEPQAIGRAARVMAATLPPSVEEFRIVPVSKGLPLSRVVLRRSDIEDLAHDPDGAWRIYARAQIDSGTGLTAGTEFNEDLYQKLFFNLQPYVGLGLFDPDAPVRADVGIEAVASYEVTPGLILSGSFRQKVIGNLATSDRPSNSVLPKVRSESNIYAKSQPTLANLTLAYFYRPGENLYGRTTVGYLEPQFGGVSTEVLWKRPDSRWAFGAELNYARQRSFTQDFYFRDYDVITGHVSAYYDFRSDYHLRIDAGRYLAGDWGATFAVDREFNNGWRIGAYATFTDVSFSDFGEGSFDKGIILSMPFSWLNGRPSRSRPELLLQPILRDGGAKLSVQDRLYDVVRDYHDPRMNETWGRVWR